MLCPRPTPLNAGANGRVEVSTSPTVPLPRSGFVLREEFRAPAGVRKSPKQEPAGRMRWSMGISALG